jgi:hypothetical protein
LVGVLIAAGSRLIDVGEGSLRLSALLLGLLLMLIGAPVALSGGRRTIRFNTRLRRIQIRDSNRFGESARSIAFRDVADVVLDELGDQEGGSIAYDVVLRLVNGANVPLFRAASFDGMFDRNEMEARRRRIVQTLGG